MKCMRDQILCRSGYMQQLMMKGKMAMKDGRKHRKVGVKDSGKDMAMAGLSDGCLKEEMEQVMQGYAVAMLPTDIRTNCKHYCVNELDNEKVPQPLSASVDRSVTAMEDERKGVINCDLKGQLANATMKMYWHENTPQPLMPNLDG